MKIFKQGFSAFFAETFGPSDYMTEKERSDLNDRRYGAGSGKKYKNGKTVGCLAFFSTMIFVVFSPTIIHYLFGVDTSFIYQIALGFMIIAPIISLLSKWTN